MNNGDIVKYDYDMIIGDSNDLYDTTRAETAKKYNVFNEKKTYMPAYTVLGSGVLIKGFEKALMEAEIGVTKEIELEPKDAFGDRNPKLVEIHSIQELRRHKIEPELGKEIVLNNKTGRIVSVSPGRVRVDFNNELAGKKIKINFTVLGKVETPEDKVRAVITMAGVNPDEFGIKIDGEVLDLVLPDSAKYDQAWILRKMKLVKDIRTHTGIKTIRLIEEYHKKEEKEEKDVKEEKKEEKPQSGNTETSPSSGEEKKEVKEVSEQTHVCTDPECKNHTHTH
ncbi:MAG: FKBP-type peptidyl-prolyl cis-trans isomerase [Thermoplasmata archaeon]